MINTKTKGELGNRIEYDVEHDLFHPQNVYSEEYITPTFIEYVRKLEKENEHLLIELEETKLAIDSWKKNADFWHKETKSNKFRKLAKDREKQITELEKDKKYLDECLDKQIKATLDLQNEYNKLKESILKLESQRNAFKNTVQIQNKYIEELEDFKKKENYKRACQLKYAKMKKNNDEYKLSNKEKYDIAYQNAIDNMNIWR